VQRDFLYQQAKGIRNQAELDDFLKRNRNDFGKVQWRLEKLPITMDIFTPKTQRMILSREGGSSNPFQVPRDAERHSQQLKMIQQKGVSEEPIIVAKLANGYDLIEGWHRTIQHLKEFPQGYTAPAWVGYGATYTSESVGQDVAEGFLDEASSDEAWELVGQPVPEIQQFVKQMGYGNNEQSVAKITAFIDKAQPSQIPSASIPKLKNLANKGTDVQTLKAVQQISGRPDAEQQYTKLMKARDAAEGRNRDVSGYLQYVKSGNYDPPVLLKLPTGIYVIGGRTRLYAALALGVPANVKIISANNFKQGVAEGVSNSMSTDDMIAYLRQHHDTNLHQDYLNHLNTFSKFVLKDIPVNSIKTDLSGLDREKVEQYKQMDFSKAPPIVMGGGYILDGYHRANVAKALGIPTIKAYVGITTK
jgi:hypothetical protein